MLGRIATNASVHQWTLAAAGLGVVIAIVIATAPKPSCKCAPAPVQPSYAFTKELLAKVVVMSPERAYLTLVQARNLDANRDTAETIDLMLSYVAPRAAVRFAALEDWDNAAAAILVAEDAAR
jgi:hypothetical protein